MFDVKGRTTAAGAAAAARALLLSDPSALTLSRATIAARIKLFARNLVDSSPALFPALASGFPNPGSQWAASPGVNLQSGEWGRPWETGGLFIFSSLTTKGYEMAANWKFRLTQTATVDIDIRTAGGPGIFIDAGSTVIFQDPYQAAGRLQAIVRASALAFASLFTVTFSGWRDAVPTYMFTVACPGHAFTLNVAQTASGWQSLGFTTTRTAVTTATGDERAIHTEEPAVLALGPRFLTFDNGGTYIDEWRHLILTSNFNPASQAAPFGATAGADKIVVYTASDAAGLDQSAGGSELSTQFTLSVDSRLGTNWFTDAAGWAGQTATTPDNTKVIFPCTFLWIDFYGWYSEDATHAVPWHPFLRLKIVNRQNPAGRLSIGPLYVGPGLHNIWNVARDADEEIVDRSVAERLPSGALLARYVRGGQSLSMKTSVLTKEEAHLLRGALLDARAIDTSRVMPLAPDRTLIASKVRQVWAIDPSNPSIFLPSHGAAYGMIAGRIASFAMRPSGRFGQGYVEADLVVDGER